MAEPKSYRWLSAGALVALALALFVALLGLRHGANDRARDRDIRARADRTIERIEAEVDRLENAAAAN
jgi:hypothetical protein